MSADEPLEDDPWQELSWESIPRPNRIATIVGGSVMVVGCVATGLVGWFRDRNVAWLAFWTSIGCAGALLFVGMARSRRVQAFLSESGRGDYRGPYWLGAELERRTAQRRRRILSRRGEEQRPPEPPASL